MARRELQVRGSSVLMWRLGPLGYYKQNMWDRAPESKGMWAFPWPHFEDFFAMHQYYRLMPKHLQYITGTQFPADPSYYQHEDGSPVRREDIQWVDNEEGYQKHKLVEGLSLLPDKSLEGDRYTWVRTVGRHKFPRRKFYWEGEVYTHLNPHQSYKEFHQQEFFDNLDTWFRMDVREYARLLQRYHGSRLPLSRECPAELVDYIDHECTHLEVFLSPKLGRFHGTVGAEH